MKKSEFKQLIISSLDQDIDPVEIARKINEAGVKPEFSDKFTERVLNAVYSSGYNMLQGNEFAINLDKVFYRIAFTGIAAIIILLISILFAEGSFSLDSLLGISNSHDESFIFLLTGN